MVALTQQQLRSELGDFSSIICFKAVVTGIEEALGEKAAAIALISAGRQRGKQLAESLNLTNSWDTTSLEEITQKVSETLGKEGTRLCIVDKIESQGEVYRVYTRETICSSGEPQGSSRVCTYTSGAIQGFLEAVTGKKLRGKQIGSVLRGDNYDILEYSVL